MSLNFCHFIIWWYWCFWVIQDIHIYSAIIIIWWYMMKNLNFFCFLLIVIIMVVPVVFLAVFLVVDVVIVVIVVCDVIVECGYGLRTQPCCLINFFEVEVKNSSVKFCKVERESFILNILSILFLLLTIKNFLDDRRCTSTFLNRIKTH